MAADTVQHSAHPIAEAPVFAAPDPLIESRRLLTDAQQMMDEALAAVKGGGQSAIARDLIGRSSDRIGQALYHMRALLRR
jgi:hypothetical protein